MTSMKEIVEMVRLGKLILPTDLTLRNLVLDSILNVGFDPTRNLSAEFDQVVAEREREMREQQEEQFNAKQKQIEALSNQLLKLASRNWIFTSAYDGSKIELDSQKMRWGGADFVQCPLEGRDVEFKSPIMLLLREFAEGVVSGERKSDEVTLCFFIQEKLSSPNTYFYVDCGKADCGGSRDYACKIQAGRLRLERRS